MSKAYVVMASFDEYEEKIVSTVCVATDAETAEDVVSKLNELSEYNRSFLARLKEFSDAHIVPKTPEKPRVNLPAGDKKLYRELQAAHIAAINAWKDVCNQLAKARLAKAEEEEMWKKDNYNPPNGLKDFVSKRFPLYRDLALLDAAIGSENPEWPTAHYWKEEVDMVGKDLPQ